jgi:phosphate transport system protein
MNTVIKPDPEISEMARRARQMLRDALTAFVRADGALGRDVCRADDEVDAMHNSVFRILVTHMMEDARTITPSLEMLLVSRNLERVADLATNIGEDAVFLAEGKQIKHHAEEQAALAAAGDHA